MSLFVAGYWSGACRLALTFFANRCHPAEENLVRCAPPKAALVAAS